MLTEELMKKVRELEIAMRRSVSEVFSGEYSSAFRGRGMEFAEVREYMPGDDIRTIDWNVTARQDAPFVKRYVEERELTVILAVDLSASGAFGSIQRIKNETAAELCGVVALAATKNNDKVGLAIFDSQVRLFIPPAKGMKHVLRIIRELLQFGSDGDRPFRRDDLPRGTDIGGALEFIGRVQRRRSVIFLVSDFLVPEAAWSAPGGAALRAGSPDPARSAEPARGGIDAALRILARRHDVIAACLADEREKRLPLRGAGLIELEDAETGRRFVIDSGSRRIRDQFQRSAEVRQRRLKDRLRRAGIDQIEVLSHEPYVHTLIELFRRRERRR